MRTRGAVSKAPRAPRPRKTHINDLADNCLVTILSLVGDAPLPIERPQQCDIVISHPLQCALVCKRWRFLAREAVHSLVLTKMDLEEDFQRQAAHFTGLRRLRIVRGRTSHALGDLGPKLHHSLRFIASATPGLTHLDLDLTHRLAYDVCEALLSWTHLKELCLTDFFEWGKLSDSMRISLLNLLPKLTCVESVSLLYDGVDPEAVWNCLRPPLMPQLKSLALNCAAGPELPPAMKSVPSLDLRFRGALPHKVLQFGNIRKLEVMFFEGEKLPDEIGWMGRLESLTIAYAHELAELPSTLGQLAALESLIIRDCKMLLKLPECVADLRALRTLHLVSCVRLEGLPNRLEQLTGVRNLVVKQAGGIKLPTGGLGALRELEELVLWGSGKEGARTSRLERIPNLNRLSRLTRLTLQNHPMLKCLPRCVGDLSRLQEMRLVGLNFMMELPESLVRLQNLELLELVRCGIWFLPGKLGQLRTLTRLFVASCDSFRGLPSTMGELTSLRELHVRLCTNFEDLPVGVAQLTGLRELAIVNCKSFRDKKGVLDRLSMTSLKVLEVGGYEAPESLLGMNGKMGRMSTGGKAPCRPKIRYEP